MSIESISELAQKVRSEYETTDPLKLCRMLEIQVGYGNYGTGDDALKALILHNSRSYTIMINNQQHPRTQKFLCWHELGHYFLNHLERKRFTLMQDYCLINDSCRMEIEANIFVADYLLDTEETLESLKRTRNIFKSACELFIPYQFLTYKMRTLQYLNKLDVDCPIEVPSTFMGKIDCSGFGDDEYNEGEC